MQKRSFVIFGRNYFQADETDVMKMLFRDVINWENVHYIPPTDSFSFRYLTGFYENTLGKWLRRRRGIPFALSAYKRYGECAAVDRLQEPVFLFVRFEPWFFGKNGFLSFLRKRYPDCRLVYILLNVNRYLHIDFDWLKSEMDLVVTIDEEDSKEFDLLYHPFVYSKNEVNTDGVEESDLFYIGRAKKRLPILLDIYEKVTAAGLRCDFYVVDVPPEQQKYADKIHYNQALGYDELLKHVCQTACLLEVMQEGQAAGTLRQNEAITYKKKLLTNNSQIKDRPFFREEYVSVFNSAEDLNVEFIKCPPKDIDYHYSEQISPIHLLEDLSRLLDEAYKG